MSIKIGVVSLGCPKNLIDSEIMLGILKEQDYEIVNDQSKADIILVNTCGFIESAKQESINTILEMVEMKKVGCKAVIATGCLAERYKEDIMNAIPEVDAVVGTGNYQEICEVINKVLNGDKIALYGKLDSVSYLNNERVLTTKKGYAYLKMAEGCDNCCTYCVIPSLRGKYRSRPIDDIINEAKKLAGFGVKELVLVAQDTTRYGVDLYNERKLVELLKELAKIEEVLWIRLLYCYPEEIDDALINEIKSNPKVLKYIDMPIQHSSDKILKTMGRRGDSTQISNVMGKLRTIPGMVIRTSIIVGFPGEECDDFENLKEFILSQKFDRMGVFTYSKEEGTPASKFKSQVTKREKQKRYDYLMKLQKQISKEKNDIRVGKEYTTIVEGVSDDGIFYFGRTYAEAPEIDGSIYFTSMEPLDVGDFVKIKILNSDDYDLIGEVLYEST